MIFLREVFTGVTIAIIAAIIINLLGLNRSGGFIVVPGQKITKKWKIFIILSYLAGFIGLFLLLWGIPNGGMENVKTQWGITLIAISVCFEISGRLGLWWNRN